jgi:hypothetical protein
MNGFSTFMSEGGWGMWPILLLGLLTLVTAARYTARPEPHALRFVAALWLALASVVVHAGLTDLAAVFGFLASSDEVTDAALPRVLLTGLKEATRPAALGGIFLTLAPLCVAAGLWRAPASGGRTG